jgi:hypothetical protein
MAAEDGGETTRGDRQSPLAAEIDVDMPERSTADEELSPDFLAADDGVALGDDDQQRAANAFLRALAAAARSFLLYETSNKAIRKFLEQLQKAADAYFSTYELMDLEVRPFELMLDGRPVYLERDRERSLAFKLYRDGVSGIALRSGLTWEELVQLLELMSIRYVGVRSSEDDMVTLLWKAGFEFVTIRAVEGYVELEQESELDVDAQIMTELAADDSFPYPWDFDLPVELPEERAKIVYRKLPQRILDKVRAQLEGDHIQELSTAVAHRIVRLIEDPTDPFAFSDAVGFLDEVRLFSSHAERTATLLALADLVGRIELTDEKEALGRDLFMERVLSRDTLLRILRTLNPERDEIPAGMVELLERTAEDPLELSLVLLESASGMRQRAAARRLVALYARDRTDIVVARAEGASGNPLEDIIHVIGTVAPQLLVRFIDHIHEDADPEVIVALLEQTAHQGGDFNAIRMACLRSQFGEVRNKAFELLTGQEHFGLFAAITTMAKRGVGISRDEGLLYGEELVRQSPERVLETFDEWMKKAKFLGATRTLTDDQVRIGCGALGHIPGAEAGDLLDRLYYHASFAVRDEVKETRGRQRLLREGPVPAGSSEETP